MKKKWIISLVLTLAVSPVLILSACSGSETPAAASYDAVWADPVDATDTISLPLDTITTNRNVHFNVDLPKGTATFMAYTLDGKTSVRASICVPCRSRSFTLKGDKLVCDACGTVFNAVNGNGISGACVSYPKAAVAFETDANNIIMNKVDLTKAFDETLSPGLP